MIRPGIAPAIAVVLVSFAALFGGPLPDTAQAGILPPANPAANLPANFAADADRPPLLFVQQRMQTYTAAPRVNRPPRYDGPRRPSGGERAIGIGIGILVPLAIDAMNQPHAEPDPDTPPASSSPHPPRKKTAFNPWIKLPNPAPLPQMRPDQPADAFATDDQNREFRAREFIALLADGANADAAAGIANDFNLTLLRETTLRLTGRRIVAFAIPDGRDVVDVENAVRADPRTAGAQMNFVYRLSGSPAPGSMASGQYALKTLDVVSAHGMARGRGVTIAVIDSTVASDHPELNGAIAETFDAAGYGVPGADKHGTSIAGIIGARAALVGMAPGARLLAIRAFWKDSEKGPVTSSSEVIARAIDWAVAQGAQVLNLSFAGPDDGLIAETLLAARAHGVIAVAAAGNNGPDAPPCYPGALDGVIAVTATDARNALFAGANRGSYIDVAAPGVDILAPAPEGRYQTITGTSMSTAYISGLMALVIEAASGKAIAPDDARALVTTSARDLGKPGPDPDYGAGLANTLKAIAEGSKRATAAVQ